MHITWSTENAMPLYAFTPIDLPAPPPAAPGTDFADFAAANLPDPDPADALVSSLLSGAQGGLNDALLDMTYLTSDINSAVSALWDIINETESEDYSQAILYALYADAEFATLDDSAGADLTNFFPSLAYLLDSWIGGFMQDWVQTAIQDTIVYVDGMINQLISNSNQPWYY